MIDTNLVVIVKVEFGDIVKEIESTLMQVCNIVVMIYVIQLVAGSNLLLSDHVVSCIEGCTN